MPRLTLQQHLTGEGPKRILALDGGGVRGALTLSYLDRIESLLRRRYGNDRLLLSDYFDLIGGTSTGAIIAAGLAAGYDVSRLQELYGTLADEIFRPTFWRRGLVFAKYRHRPLKRLLEREFGEFTLGDERLRTGLMIMTKRWDTGSPWVLHNHPRGPYYGSEDPCDSDPVPNRCYNLAQIVRASTAAPTFFRPEMIEIARGQTGRFVDGGVTPHNNPVLQLLLLATLHGYGFRWRTGADDLLMISVGTGAKDPKMSATLRERLARKLSFYDGLTSLAGLMGDCDALNLTMLHAISKSAAPWEIDGEIGDLSSDLLAGRALLSYRRYNVLLTPKWMARELEIEVSDEEARTLFKMDRPENVEPLSRIGASAAERQVDAAHFPPAFDLGPAQLPE